jgi:hypothetical protein
MRAVGGAGLMRDRLIRAAGIAAVLAAGIVLVASRRRNRRPTARDGGGPAPAGRGPGVKRWLADAAIVLVALAILGFLGVASGIVPIKASAGHWAVTRWFLGFAMHRSIDTHSLTVTAPSLDEPRLVLKGAGHYDLGCRPCHGTPGEPRPRIALGMTPSPPYLPPVVPDGSPRSCSTSSSTG